jgi:hypothetical protein
VPNDLYMMMSVMCFNLHVMYNLLSLNLIYGRDTDP